MNEELGTSFNVRSYQGDTVTHVVVSTGRVMMIVRKSANDAAPPMTPVVAAGDEGTMTVRGFVSVDRNADLARSIGWLDGELRLDSAPTKALEPGRDTVILEPQAVHQLMVNAIYALDRYLAEYYFTVYTLRPGQSKIGLQIFDCPDYCEHRSHGSGMRIHFIRR